MESKEGNTSTNMTQDRTDNKSKRAGTRLFVLFLLLAFCTLFYYFGELVVWAAWDALRAQFFYGVHDVHRLLFLAPIIYAGYTARVKGAMIITMIAFLIFLPRAFFISPYPDPLLRMLLFIIFAGVIGALVGTIRNQAVKSQRLEAAITGERDRLLKIVDAMADGVVITGPDYRIRFMNSKMADTFGAGTGIACYKYLRHADAPCAQECHIADVIGKGEIGKWECSLPDGKSIEMLAVPYVDADGTTCQISIFRDLAKRGDN